MPSERHWLWSQAASAPSMGKRRLSIYWRILVDGTRSPGPRNGGSPESSIGGKQFPSMLESGATATTGSTGTTVGSSNKELLTPSSSTVKREVQEVTEPHVGVASGTRWWAQD